MITLPDFNISAAGKLSDVCLAYGLLTFKQLINFVWELPYGRNTNKNDLTTVFTDGCGTCGTKHALLKQVAIEQGVDGIRLMTGLFRMNGTNTPAVAKRLKENGLAFIPEAHCYLVYKGRRFDFTKAGSAAFDFEPYLIEEKELQPDQITDYKVHYQKNYLRTWLAKEAGLHMDPDTLWNIREQCIQDLSG